MPGGEEAQGAVPIDDYPDDEADLTTASDVCCCGPHYDEETAKKNQLLRVPRVTTDQPSLLIIFFFVFYMGLVWAYAIHKGQYSYLIHGMDWRGQACGHGDLKMYPHQAWTNPLMPNIRAGAICVKSCPAPKKNAEIDKNELYCLCNKDYWPVKFGSGAGRSGDLIAQCEDSVAAIQGYFVLTVNKGDALLDDAKTGPNGGIDQPCSFTYRTQWAMHKCVPWVSGETLQSVVIQNHKGNVTESHDYVSDWLGGSKEIFATFVSDVATCRSVVGVCIGLSVVLSIVSLLSLKYSVEAVSKGMLVVLLALFVGISIQAHSQYDFYRERVDSVPQLSTHEQDQQSMYVYLAGFITAVSLSVLQVGFAVFMIPELPKAISIIKVASQSFVDAPQILLFPVVHIVSFILLITFWLVGAVLLYSAGDIKVGKDGVANMDHTPGIRSSAVGYLYGLFWMSGFMNAMGYMIVAGTVYLCTFALPKNRGTEEEPDYSEGDKEVPDSVMTASAVIMIRYHLGTAAFGSLVFSLVWPLRLATNLFGKLGQSENESLKFVCCCCRCCFNSWENCFKYLNKMAYLQTVLHGFSFCGAAYEGLVCVMKGIENVGPTTLISTSLLIVIKLVISLTVTGFAHILISNELLAVKPEDLTYSWVPYGLVFFVSFIVCTAFMLVLEVAIDAVMVAFCEAEYEEKGAIKPQQLPPALREHIVKYGLTGPETQPLLQSLEVKD